MSFQPLSKPLYPNDGNQIATKMINIVCGTH